MSTFEGGESKGASKSFEFILSNINRFESRFLSFTSSSVLKFSRVEGLKGVYKQCVKKIRQT